jgi:hypothetical protein
MSNSTLKKMIFLENNILSLNFLKKNEFTMLGLYISFTLCNYFMGSYKTFFIIGLLTGKVIFFNKNKNISNFREHLLLNLKINYKSNIISNKQNGEISEEILEEILEKNANNDENIKETMNDESSSSDSFDTCVIKNNNYEGNNEDDTDNQQNLSQSYINSQLNINDSYIEEKANSIIRTRSMSRKND